MSDTDSPDELKRRAEAAESRLADLRKRKAESQARWRGKQRMGSENVCVEAAENSKT